MYNESLSIMGFLLFTFKEGYLMEIFIVLSGFLFCVKIGVESMCVHVLDQLFHN